MVPIQGEAEGLLDGVRREPKGGGRSDEARWRVLKYRLEFSRAWYFVGLKRKNQNARRNTARLHQSSTHCEDHCRLCSEEPDRIGPTRNPNLDGASGTRKPR